VLASLNDKLLTSNVETYLDPPDKATVLHSHPKPLENRTCSLQVPSKHLGEAFCLAKKGTGLSSENILEENEFIYVKFATNSPSSHLHRDLYSSV